VGYALRNFASAVTKGWWRLLILSLLQEKKKNTFLGNILLKIRHSLFIAVIILDVKEVVTLQKKYLLYLHQKMRFTPSIDTITIL